ncbi:MAG: APC family permease [Pseudomonadota bacterium]
MGANEPSTGTGAGSGPAAGEERLDRVLGVRQLGANIVNYVVGSGIFVLPALVAAALGPAALTAYLVAALAVGLVALCFAECGSRVAASGGTYAYVETAFGKLPGAFAGAFGYLSYVVASAAVANVFVGSLAALWSPLGEPLPRAGLLLLLYSGLTWLNMRGVSSGARLVEITTVGKLAPLVLRAVAGGFFLEPAYFAGFEWPEPAVLAATTLLLIFAFTGTEGALTPSGEVRDPARTVPRAIAFGLLIVTALYGALQVAAQGVLGPDPATEKSAPLAAAAERIAGAPGGTLILVAAAISTFGYMASNVLSSPRVLFGLARDGLLPKPLAAVHRTHHTPHVAILGHSALAFTLALGGEFGPLALVSTVSTMMLYLGCAAAALELRRRDVRAGGAPFVAPGGPVVPILSIGVTLWLLSGATSAEWRAVGGVAVAVLVAYALRAWRLRSRGSAP